MSPLHRKKRKEASLARSWSVLGQELALMLLFVVVGFVLPIQALSQLPANSSSKGDAERGKGVPPEERKVLVELFEATDGPHWKNYDGWLGPAGTECDWYGVQCWVHFGPNAVTDIELGRNNLTGSIPESITQLSKLQSLDLIGNHLAGMLPDPLIQRWLDGSLDIFAEAPLLTDLTEIDYEDDPSSLLCGQRRIIFRSDGSAVMFTSRCRNASPRDRATFCEVRRGHIVGATFAMLAWLVQKNGFFDLQAEYTRNITDSVFDSIRVVRNGKTFQVVEYAGGGPFELWTIKTAIDGVASSVDWDQITRQPKYPRWDEGPKK